MMTGSKAKMLLGPVFLISFIFLAVGCDSMQRMQRQEERRMASTKKQIDQQKSERDKVYQEQTERQKKIQTKETRKQMKELERKSKRWREGKPQETFYERWWNNLSEKMERRRDRRRD